MASSSTSESDSLPVIYSKHKDGSRANPDDWITKVNIFFRASHGLIAATRLYALPSAVPVPTKKNCFLQPCTVSAPPFNIPRFVPVHVDLHCHWLNNLKECYTIFLLVAPPCKKSYVRPCNRCKSVVLKVLTNKCRCKQDVALWRPFSGGVATSVNRRYPSREKACGWQEMY